VKKDYLKPHLNVKEQVALLQSRGLEVSDCAKAEEVLLRIGYYRLAGYAFSMRSYKNITLPNGKASRETFENFRNGSRLCDVVDLYVFDKKLRMLMLDAIERVEIALRIDIAHHFGEIDPHFHRNAARFHHTFSRVKPNGDPSEHSVWLDKQDKAFYRSGEPAIQSFKDNFHLPAPIWIAIECWDFGTLSHFISALESSDIDTLAARFSIPRGTLLKSWLRSLNHVRNICAHHGRLWNKALVDWPAPTTLGEIPALDHLSNNSAAQKRTYAAACVLRWLMMRVNPASSWHNRIGQHLLTFPQSPLLHLSATGFPENWASLPLWR
jgi:abortive infection bacteriophage resistance protein